jgi:hypothetical protein
MAKKKLFFSFARQMKVCGVCKVETSTRCPECYIDDAVYYCCREHQLQDRQNHLQKCCRFPIALRETQFEFGHALTTSVSHLLRSDNQMNYLFVLKAFPLQIILKNIMGVDSAIFAQLVQWSLIGSDSDFTFGLGPMASYSRLNDQSKLISICRPVVLHPKNENYMYFMKKVPSRIQYLLEYKDGTLLGQSTNGPKRGNKEFWVDLCLKQCDPQILDVCGNANDWYLNVIQQ